MTCRQRPSASMSCALTRLPECARRQLAPAERSTTADPCRDVRVLDAGHMPLSVHAHADERRPRMVLWNRRHPLPVPLVATWRRPACAGSWLSAWRCSWPRADQALMEVDRPTPPSAVRSWGVTT
jgi:hypothetical protein